MAECLSIELEFSGGAELLMKEKQKIRKITLPKLYSDSKKGSESIWTIKILSEWIKDNLLAERPELFFVNGTVRPGILVLVNDTDWELLGESEYEIQNNDKISFISTLHEPDMNSNAKVVASEFVNFLNKAVTPYHAVEECSQLLKSAGFHELKETDQWKLEPCNKYYITRNKSTIIAFAIGGLFKPGNGVAMVAAHTDSPCLRVKPNSKTSSAGCLQVGVSTYGGGIWRTWFDRDLTVAGRVLVQDDKGHVQQKLAHIEKPIFSIPNLAIHLDRDANEKFVFNKEDHLKPILATFVAQKLNESSQTKLKSPEETVNSDCECDPQNHHSILMQILAENIGVRPKQIVDFDLCLVDTQPARIGGVYEEFIYGPRLDNLVCTYSSITALIKSCDNEASLRNDNHIRLVACYDNEECGSESAQGAASTLTEWTLRRLQNGHTYSTNGNKSRDQHDPCSFERSIASSFLISADQAHACHPNYKSKYEDCHAPSFHKGVVVKINPNQRYATTTLTSSFLQQVADRASVPLQRFVVRNDSTCGSTVGPILSAKLGLQTVDIGTPQLAMHSIREMACISGVYYAQVLFEKYFEAFNEVLQSFEL